MLVGQRALRCYFGVNSQRGKPAKNYRQVQSGGGIVFSLSRRSGVSAFHYV